MEWLTCFSLVNLMLGCLLFKKLTDLVLFQKQLQSFTKYLKLTLVFMRNSALPEKFFMFFLLVLTKFLFWQEGWALGYLSMKFRHFPDIS